jgi:hypothetical protein
MSAELFSLNKSSPLGVLEGGTRQRRRVIKANFSFSHPTPGIFPTPKDLIISPQQAAGQQLQ